MKKSLVLMAMAGVTLAGCVNDVTDLAQSQELKKVKITFDAPTMYDNGAESRIVYGEITHQSDKSYPQDEDFIVYAKAHVGPFVSWDNGSNINIWGGASACTRVSFNEGLQGWQPVDIVEGQKVFHDYYWQVGSMITFAAYSPADAEATSFSYSNTGLTIIDFQVPTNHEEQYDLMFGKRAINETNSNQTWNGYSGTPIQFQHALSSVHFALVGGEYTNAKLKSITLKNILDKGTFNEGIDAENQTNYVRTGENKNVNPTWTHSSVSEEDETLSTANYTPYENLTDVAFPKTATLMHNLVGEENHAHLLLMPQAFDSESTAQLVVVYEEKKGDEEYVEKTATVPLKTSGLFSEWVMGTRYIYVLSLGGTNKIFFAPGVDTWTEVKDVVVSLDSYTPAASSSEGEGEGA